MQPPDRDSGQDSDITPDARKSYHTPALTYLGTISEMTEGGAGSGGEVFAGS